MLKIESNKKAKIDISLQSRERFFNRSLLTALAAALALHLIVIFVFQIHRLIGQAEKKLPPAFVEADLSVPLDNANDILALAKDPLRKQLYLEPLPSTPPVPEMPNGFYRQMEDVGKIDLYSNPFDFLEDDWEYLNEPKAPLKAQNVQLRISGPLAEISLKNDGLASLPDNWKKNAHGLPLSVAYYVQVESRTGKIFWYNSKHAVPKALSRITEKILHNLQFEKQEKGFIESGEIEIEIE